MDKVLDFSENQFNMQVFKIEEAVYFSKRIHYWPEDERRIEVFGSCWNVVFGEYEDSSFGICNAAEGFAFKDKWVFLIPPFSIIHWDVKKSWLKWISYTGISDPPETFPAASVAIKIADIPKFETKQEILDYVQKTLDKTPLSDREIIEKNNHTHTVAVRTKSYIQKHFQEDLSILSISETLGYSHSVMSRYFKRNYSLTVIQYRNQLRLFQSLLDLLSTSSAVSNVAQNCGHKDLSKFYRSFRQRFMTSPSSYSSKTPVRSDKSRNCGGIGGEYRWIGDDGLSTT